MIIILSRIRLHPKLDPVHEKSLPPMEVTSSFFASTLISNVIVDRVDFALRDDTTKGLRQFLKALKAHGSYFSSDDVMYFILERVELD